MSISNSGFIYHDRRNPCPLCGGTSDCRSVPKPNCWMTFCRRTPPYSPPSGWTGHGTDRNGFNYFTSDDPNPRLDAAFSGQARSSSSSSSSKKRRSKKSIGVGIDAGDDNSQPSHINNIKKNRRDMADFEIARTGFLWFGFLCGRAPFDAFNIKIVDDPWGNADRKGNIRQRHCLPELSPTGEEIGIKLRTMAPDGFLTKVKPFANGSVPGIYFANDLKEKLAANPDAEVKIPEGLTDTMTLWLEGVLAVGRSSNLCGGEMIGELLHPYGLDRPITVLSENDRKDDGGHPGLEGAEKTVAALEKMGFTNVAYQFPPFGAKDVRNDLRENAPSIIAGQITPHDVGQGLDEQERIRLIVKDAAKKPIGSDGAAANGSEFDFEPVWGPEKTSKIEVANRVFPSTPEPDSDNDSFPSADGFLPYAKPAEYCPTPSGALMQHMRQPKAGVWRFACRRLKCPICGPRRIVQLSASIQYHVHRHVFAVSVAESIPASAVTLHLYRIDDVNAASFTDLIREHGGKYAKCRGKEYTTVLSTTSVTSKHLVSEAELPAQEAVDLFIKELRDIDVLTKNAYTHSRAWPVLERGRPEAVKQWVKFGKGKITCDKFTILKILTHHGVILDAETIEGVDNNGGDVENIVKFSTEGIDLQALLMDLCAGEIVSNINLDGWEIDLTVRASPP